MIMDQEEPQPFPSLRDPAPAPPGPPPAPQGPLQAPQGQPILAPQGPPQAPQGPPPAPQGQQILAQGPPQAPQGHLRVRPVARAPPPLAVQAVHLRRRAPPQPRRPPQGRPRLRRQRALCPVRAGLVWLLETACRILLDLRDLL